MSPFYKTLGLCFFLSLIFYSDSVFSLTEEHYRRLESGKPAKEKYEVMRKVIHKKAKGEKLNNARTKNVDFLKLSAMEGSGSTSDQKVQGLEKSEQDRTRLVDEATTENKIKSKDDQQNQAINGTYDNAGSGSGQQDPNNNSNEQWRTLKEVDSDWRRDEHGNKLNKKKKLTPEEEAYEKEKEEYLKKFRKSN